MKMQTGYLNLSIKQLHDNYTSPINYPLADSVVTSTPFLRSAHPTRQDHPPADHPAPFAHAPVPNLSSTAALRCSHTPGLGLLPKLSPDRYSTLSELTEYTACCRHARLRTPIPTAREISPRAGHRHYHEKIVSTRSLTSW